MDNRREYNAPEIENDKVKYHIITKYIYILIWGGGWGIETRPKVLILILL